MRAVVEDKVTIPPCMEVFSASVGVASIRVSMCLFLDDLDIDFSSLCFKGSELLAVPSLPLETQARSQSCTYQALWIPTPG